MKIGITIKIKMEIASRAGLGLLQGSLADILAAVFELETTTTI